ncbi:hypothetical protein [Thiomicrorhabdus lithotrophica]|uniref:Uncharacterized protein n=1 Tax=Thiomicrorhabdus lithotrophica TaxID=2949997 RepID=A0ABY8CAX6_9GAMM|nr:hypothetical protein [Thiomicrorhabdus lithotrophica]WEJ61558.1 hypothetical protein NR989_05955 [Thiomicrorhabdus lithotrophica]
MMNFIYKRVYIAIAILFSLVSTTSLASNFNVGNTVFVAYPAANIKDDAFIVGKVNQIMPNGDFKISVLDYVEGHDYGVSCVPMVKNESKASGNGLGDVWELWTDTTKLEKEKLDYVVSKDDVLDLGYGKSYFIERNNLYIVFGRWKSDAPMLNIERVIEAEKQARLNGLADMIPAFELVKLHRMSFYGDFGRPLQAFESIRFLVSALNEIDRLFQSDKILKMHWYAKARDWKKLSKNTKLFFLIEAIDKIVEDAKDQLYADGIEQAAPEDLEQLNSYLNKLKRR